MFSRKAEGLAFIPTLVSDHLTSCRLLATTWCAALGLFTHVRGAHLFVRRQDDGNYYIDDSILLNTFNNLETQGIAPRETRVLWPRSARCAGLWSAQAVSLCLDECEWRNWPSGDRFVVFSSLRGLAERIGERNLRGLRAEQRMVALFATRTVRWQGRARVALFFFAPSTPRSNVLCAGTVIVEYVWIGGNGELRCVTRCGSPSELCAHKPAQLQGP